MRGAARRVRAGAKWLATGIGVAAASYAAFAGLRWYRYGEPKPPVDGEEDPLLDRFMPDYDVVERHQVLVAAPVEVTFATARQMDPRRSSITRTLFKGRDLLMRSHPSGRALPSGLIEMASSLGWVVLAEVPGREIVVGAATQPWRSDVEFVSVRPDAFAAFQEPGYVKIAWTLRADPAGDGGSLFRTETRAITTDPASRAAFRRYWSLFSPGIVLIRRASLGLLKAEAERQGGRAAAPEASKAEGDEAGPAGPARLGSG